LAEKRCNHGPVVLHTANAATASAIRPANGMAPDLRGNDLLLTASQQPLRLGESQTQVGEIGEIIRPVDLHDMGAPPASRSKPRVYWHASERPIESLFYY
jgi:hypothetical protein